MELLVDFGWLALGLVLLYYGAEWLVQGATNLALKVGLAPLVIGLTVVAFGTSAPELLVSIQANLEDPPRGGFALGNVIGSNVCNLALILGVAAMVRPIPVHEQVLRREMPILIVVTLGFVWMLRDQQIERWEALVLVLVLVGYVAFSIVKGLRSGAEEELEGMDGAEQKAIREASGGELMRYVLLVGFGLVILILGANRLIEGGVGIAQYFKVPEVIIALSLVALGTSLPELATAILASLKKQGDLIVGNVVGSNLFNILAVVGVTGVIGSLVGTELKRFDLFFMLGITVVLLPMMWTRRCIGRLEGGVLLSAYLFYLIWMF